MTNQVISLSRKQLSQFLPTQEAVRAFEYLFKTASDSSPQNYDNISSQVDALTVSVSVLASRVSSLESENAVLVNELAEMEKMLNERGVR